jgi:Na+-transporting NADH:ubiquinone oxidoreductase subunit NqrB
MRGSPDRHEPGFIRRTGPDHRAPGYRCFPLMERQSMASFVPGPRGRIDPRYYQIAALAALLAAGLLWFGIDTSLWQLAVIAAAALTTQAAASRACNIATDWRSPLITALGLTLLLRSHDPRLWALAGAAAIGSKFLLRWRGKHLFNPACFAIVLLLQTGAVWVSPGQWGAQGWGVAALLSAAGLVLSRAGRVDVAAAYLGGTALLLAARCLTLGDPMTIPLHQLQSGALLVFGFFMITDPRSTPDSAAARVLFGLAVAVMAYFLSFQWQIRTAPFYALMAVSLATPLLDAVLPGRRFVWSPAPQEA